jgi:hypothetical protein
MCGTPSSRINLWYERSLADAPVGGRPVKILLSVRHLFCDDPGYVRRTFAEQVPDLTFRYGRRTVLERVAVTAIGIALAGRVPYIRDAAFDQVGEPDLVSPIRQLECADRLH